ncbi:MAG: flagellar hook-associated protein FlgK [Patescibacteria group bacterium]|nr:flagellar hook-associated protein FlgK [Patescibacteria group bacterium]
MSLFSSITLAANSLRVNQIALQVVGQNIANANTEGYIREQVILTPAPTQRIGGVLLGMGVQVSAVIQKIDYFLEERLRGAVSEQASTASLESSYSQLEAIIGELTDTDLSTSMNNFFAAINEVLNQPEDVSVRNLAVLQGITLTQDIQRMASRAQELRQDVNSRIENSADDINRLLEEVRQLNIRIAQTEGGDISGSDAVGLRDQRLNALTSLATIMDIRVVEQPSGGVIVYHGGDFLVFEGNKREVQVVYDTNRGMTVAEVRMVDTDAAIIPTAGELNGLIDARDNVLGAFLDDLDAFATTFMVEFNKLYTSGQGLNGFSSVSGEYAVDDVDLALNETGLEFAPESGVFQVMVYNTKTKLTETTDIQIDLDGLGGNDTTLTNLCDMLNGVDGVSAEITLDRRLKITSLAADQQIAFAGDTSGILAALGMATFFTGTSARDIGVNLDVRADPAKFAASKNGIGNDTQMAIKLAVFGDQPIDSENGASITVLYSRIVGKATQGSTVARADAEGAGVFAATLRGQRLSISGVNLEEEAINMIAYQYAFTASAKFIATLTELFNILVSI